MKFLIIGLGSMGKRRLRNLLYLGHRDITGFDIRTDRREEARNIYGIETIAAVDDSDVSDFTHIIISTPPADHIEYASRFHAMGKHVFIEASVVDDGYDALLPALAERGNILAPSCTMRFDPLNIQVRDWLRAGRIGKALLCQHHFGMFLPNWHPYESIDDFYVSKRETGAAREIVPFDLVYLSWFFGLPTQIRAMTDQTGRLDADIDDVYALVFRAPGCRMVQMTVDVVSQVPCRTTRIVGETGNIDLDTVAGTLRLYDSNEDRWILKTRSKLAKTTSTEEMYVQEMRCFLDATMGLGEYPYTLAEDHAILTQLYAAERAAKS
ncbi:MAG: Gfo/Idh/MocA family oxidoreductase [Roseitalea porphyridii]|uniref:Gfo/Idh/MocA family protein n=1 Tax=Roseitalea porphyridii TaxID=1852022 RepID=UPI0032D9264A